MDRSTIFRWDAKAAKAFLCKAIERTRLHRPVLIITDKAPTCYKVIREINHCHDPNFDGIRHIDKNWRNNRIESDHAALKRLLGYQQSFRSLQTDTATLQGIEIIRTIKNQHIHSPQPGIQGKLNFVKNLFKTAA